MLMNALACACSARRRVCRYLRYVGQNYPHRTQEASIAITMPNPGNPNPICLTANRPIPSRKLLPNTIPPLLSQFSQNYRAYFTTDSPSTSVRLGLTCTWMDKALLDQRYLSQGTTVGMHMGLASEHEAGSFRHVEARETSANSREAAQEASAHAPPHLAIADFPVGNRTRMFGKRSSNDSEW